MKKQFEKRALLFLDILGFRKIVWGCVENPDQINVIYDALRLIKSHFANYKGIYKIQFSDSIVISFKAEDGGSVLEMLSSLQSLVKNIICKGYLLRGGLTFGDVYHDSEFVFGPAMIRAYDLESKKAIVPRILIDKGIIEYGRKFLPKFFNEGMDDYIFNHVSLDDDGNYFIDYFQKGIDTFWEIGGREKEYIKNLEKIIGKGLLEYDQEILKKYEWMKNKYNKMVLRLKEDTQVSCFGITLGSNKQDTFYRDLKLIK